MDDTFTNPSVNNFANARYGTSTGNLFNRLLLIPEFKNQFINRMADICNSSFAYSYTSGIYQKIYNENLPDLSLDLNRWGNGSDYSSWLFNMGQIIIFLQQRVSYQRSHLMNEFGVNGTYELTALADTTKGNIKINSILIKSSTPGIGLIANNWSGTYFDNIPLQIQAVPHKGYRFTHWIHNSQILSDSVLVINTSVNQSYEAFFERIILSANPTPVAYQLINCKYKMSSWSANTSSGTFPAHMRLVYMQNVDPSLSSGIAGNVNGVYNFTSKTRINGLNSKGIAFINTNSTVPNLGFPNGRLGGAILALNTSGIDSIKISFKTRTISSGARKYAIGLQYREGDLIDFEDFDVPINYASSTTVNDSMTFTNIFLPDSLLNKPYIQLLWRYYYTGVGTTGSRDQLAIDDIVIDAIKVQSSAGSLVGNPSYSYLGGLNTLPNLQISSSNSILFKPTFELSNGQVFEAKMQTCPEN